MIVTFEFRYKYNEKILLILFKFIKIVLEILSELFKGLKIDIEYY